MNRETRRFFPEYDVGEYTYDYNLTVFGHGNLKIGKYCSIGYNVVLILESHNPAWFTTYPFPALTRYWGPEAFVEGHPVRKKGIKIGNDVWIGLGAIIMDGVTIGDGAIICANSLVIRNVKPYSVVGGNPAEFLRTRFNSEIVDTLKKLQWWDWPEDKVRSNIKTLCSSNYEELKKLL